MKTVAFMYFFAVLLSARGAQGGEPARHVLGELKIGGAEQRVDFIGTNGNLAVAVEQDRRGAASHVTEWTWKYDFSAGFKTASFVAPTGLSSLVSQRVKSILSVVSLGGSAGEVVDVFGWDGSAFKRIGHWGGDSSNQVYSVQVVTSADRPRTAALAIGHKVGGLDVVPDVFEWVGTLKDGRFVRANIRYAAFYAAVANKELATLHSDGPWWPDAFVQVLSRVVEADAYRRSYAGGIDVAKETLTRIDDGPRAVGASTLPALWSAAHRARAKADVHLLIAVLYRLGGEVGLASRELRLAKKTDIHEYGYQIAAVRRFIADPKGSPLLIRSG